MKTKFWFLRYACLNVIVGFGVAPGQVNDQFDDGDDEGWSRLNPLDGVGGTATFSFPDGNSYRIQSGVSPDAETFGQSRAGSLRSEVDFPAFRVSVDIVGADADLEQDIGILTRVESPGLGTLGGYSATIDTDESRIYLSRVDLEQAVNIGNADITFDLDKDYRMIFHGYASEFLIEVFELPDLAEPVGLVNGFDDFYTKGSVGLFGNAGQPDGTVDVTFDNFQADEKPDTDRDGMSDPAEVAVFGDLNENGEDDFDGDGRSNAEELLEGTNPKIADSAIEVSSFSVDSDTMIIRFLMLKVMSFRLEKSSDLENWVVDESAVFSDLGNGVGEYVTGRSGSREYLRVSEVKN